MRLLVCCLLLAAAASAQDRFPVDWRTLEPEILANFTTLLKIDTSNLPGNETRAANAIRTILEREGTAPYRRKVGRLRRFVMLPAEVLQSE